WAHRRRLSRACLLGHGDLFAAVLHLHLAGSGPRAAHVSLPDHRRGAAEGGPDGMARRHVRLGVGGYWGGDDAGAGCWAGRTDHRYPLREAGTADYRRHRVWGLAVLAGNRGCRLPPRGRGRDSPRDGAVLVEPCPAGGGWLLPRPRCYRTG